MSKYIIGVDEAGRGPLAGPVTSAAVLIPKKLKLKGPKSGVRDSKKYTAKQREDWFSFIKNHPEIKYEISAVYPSTIDKINIAQAANLASTRAVKRILKRNDVKLEKCEILLDGALKLKTDLEYQVIIGGDQTIKAIQLASILAKVYRDNTMSRLHRRFEEYNFAKHKGYGTKEHRKLIKKHGICEYHRSSFTLS